MIDPDAVEVHLFAAARAAVGAAQLAVPPGSLGEVLDKLVAEAPALGAVLPRCSYLVDGIAARNADRDRACPAGSRVDVLPPFAGG